MDGKNMFLLAIIFATFLGVIFAGYYRYIVKQDYLILTNVSCNPIIESCFIHQCDSEIEECESKEPEYYALLERKAYNASTCEGEECVDTFQVCRKNENACSVIYCTEDSTEGVECSTIPAENIREGIEEVLEEAQ